MGATARARSAVIHVFPVLSDSSAETAEHAENCLTWFSSAALCLGGKPLSTDYGLGLWNSYPQLRLWPEYNAPTDRIGKGVLLWHFPYPAHPQ
jgi:hypothetical protein